MYRIIQRPLIKGLIGGSLMSVTMSDIAVRVGTSVAAVSVTLNGAKSKTLKVSEETRRRILEAAEEMGYRRNPLAGALATGRSRILGLMLPSTRAYEHIDPFFSLITSGVTSCATEANYNVMLYTAVGEDESSKAALMINRLISGMIFVSPPSNSPLFAECQRQQIPYVSILGTPENGDLTVNSDDFHGGWLATQHLIKLGHRRIAHLHGQLDIVGTQPRRDGYFAALNDAGIKAEDDLCLPGDFNRTVGYQSTRRLLSLPLDRRPTAIFAANDPSAHGAIEAISDSGLSVPKDIAVVGYDDTWYATVTRPTLTSVCVDVFGLSHRATELLVSRLDGGHTEAAHPRLPVTLTVRESCGSRAGDEAHL